MKLTVLQTPTKPYTVILCNTARTEDGTPLIVAAKVNEISLQRAIFVAREHACLVELDQEFDMHDFMPVFAAAGHHDNLLAAGARA